MARSFTLSQKYILKEETSWDELELPGTSQNHLELPGSTCNDMYSERTDTKKQENYRKKLYLQQYCSIEYNISNSYCHKEIDFSDVCRWNHLEKNGTSNQLTQIKTLIRQYCVYNIISLQNLTFQIPIVTQCSILNVGKVSQIRLCFIYTLNKKAKQLSMKIRLVPSYLVPARFIWSQIVLAHSSLFQLVPRFIMYAKNYIL